MTTAVEYAMLAAALSARDAALAVPPDGYRKAHEPPGWYDTFAGVTPAGMSLPVSPGEVPAEAELAEPVRPLSPGPAVVKDYAGSRKHEWDDACFVPDRTDTPRLHAVVSDRYCDNGGSYGRYYWYYGGRSHGGYVSRGSTVRPRRGRIGSRGGRVISHGGYVSRGG